MGISLQAQSRRYPVYFAPVVRPDKLVTLFSRALACQQAGLATEAIRLYEHLLSLRPDLPEVYNNLGVVLASLGRFGKASAAYRRAIELKPDSPQAYCNWGIVLASLGRFAEAAAKYRRAISLDPVVADVHSNLGNVLRELGRLDEAEAACRAAIALDRNHWGAYTNLGNILRELGRLDEAEASYRCAVSLNPSFAGAYCNLGNTLRELNRAEEAEAACRAAIALDRNHWEAHINLGNALKDLGRLDAAEEMFRRAIALKPDVAEAYSGLGTVMMELGRHAEAEAAFRRAITVRPGFAEAYNNLSVELKEAGRLAEAGHAAERAVQLAPRKAFYFGNLAELRSFAPGDPVLAAWEALANDAASLPAGDRIHLHFALAKAYDDVGRAEDAFQQLAAGNGLKRRQIAYDEAATLARLDRVRALFTPGLIAVREGCGDPSSAPVFIVGMPRSGTTLIEQILASHPQAFGAGELTLFEQAAGRIRNTLPGSPDFPDMVTGMTGEHFRSLGALYCGELKRRAPGAARIIDKMPSNFIFAGLIHLALPNAIIIHAVRDPIDTCVSCFSKHFVEEQKHTYDLAELGRYYHHYRTLMAHWHRALPPGRILDVHYEDVVADLEGAARRMVAHCGLPWDARCLDFHRTERNVQTASAAQVRRPIYRSSVARWRKYEAFLGPLLAELGP